MSKAAELAALIGSQTALSNRNIIINGAMQVAQRGTSATVGPNGTGEGYTVVDRFQNSLNGSVVSTFTQSTDGPSGFGNSAKIEITTADSSLGSTEFWNFRYSAEGQDLQSIAKGTSDAKAITLSFYVKSNKTGTYTVELEDTDNDRLNALAYTVDSANTWERKSLTFNADTTGEFTNDNNLSLRINFWLCSGSQYQGGTFYNGTWGSNVDANRVHSSQVNLGDTVGNEWYITGIQLEVGEQATPFEHRSFGDELNRCLRYFEKVYLNSYCCHLSAENSQQAKGGVIRFSEKRASPSLTLPTPGTGSNELGYTDNVGSAVTQGSTFRSTQTKTQMSIFNNYADGFSGMTAGENIMLYVNGNVEIDVKAEL
jgi:hypothetical protein